MSDLSREEAIEEIKRWTPILLNSGQCTEKTSEAQDMAISALSKNKATSGEYISKADMEKILYSTNNAIRIGEEFLELPTYAIPNSAENKDSAFKGMTNGEVICSVFDVMVLTIKDGKVWVERIFFPFDEVWWNAPYQKGGEEE